MKLYTIGGFNEVGRNMSALEIGDTILILDMGLEMNNLVTYNDEVDNMSIEELKEKDILPNTKMIENKKDKVKAIIVSHAHLDHVGGVQYLAHQFNCPVYATPFTIEVLKILMKSSKVKVPLKNKFIKVNVNSSVKITPEIEVEFVNVTHSTPQSALVVIHTSEGAVLYANDFKFDNRPALGQKTNYDRLKEIAQKEGFKLAVIDAVRSNLRRKTLSEIVVKEMLRDIFIESDFDNTKGIIITTFASHIARLKSIVELAHEIGRKPVFLGRSIAKYSKAAKNAGIIDFREKGVEIADNPKDINGWLARVNKNKKDYIVICTGHQGEINAVLSKIAEGKTPYHIEEDDKVIFSSEVIPTEVNIEARRILDAKLEKYRCKIYKDIHVSGHAGREDHRDLLNMVKPKVIIPGHGPVRLKEGLIDLAEEEGYVDGENLLIVEDQKVYEFK